MYASFNTLRLWFLNIKTFWTSTTDHADERGIHKYELTHIGTLCVII